MEQLQGKTLGKKSVFSGLKGSALLRISKPFKHQTMLYPFLLGTVLAWFEGGSLNWTVFFISLIAMILMVEASFISNDYDDFETDKRNRSEITGGSKVLVKGLMSKEQARTLAIASFLIALPLGIILQFYYKTGPLTLPIGLAGMLLAYAYSGRPFRLSYRGLGEISLAVNNSWTPILAGFYLQTQQVGWLPVIVSLPYMFGVFSQKLIREFPDVEADEKAERRNLPVIFGREKMAVLYIWLIVLMFVTMLPFLFLGIGHASLLLLLPPLFLFTKNLLAARRGEWKTEEGLKYMNSNGFLAMFMIPVSLIGIFLLGGF